MPIYLCTNYTKKAQTHRQRLQGSPQTTIQSVRACAYSAHSQHVLFFAQMLFRDGDSEGYWANILVCHVPNQVRHDANIRLFCYNTAISTANRMKKEETCAPTCPRNPQKLTKHGRPLSVTTWQRDSNKMKGSANHLHWQQRICILLYSSLSIHTTIYYIIIDV